MIYLNEIFPLWPLNAIEIILTKNTFTNCTNAVSTIRWNGKKQSQDAFEKGSVVLNSYNICCICWEQRYIQSKWWHLNFVQPTLSILRWDFNLMNRQHYWHRVHTLIVAPEYLAVVFCMQNYSTFFSILELIWSRARHCHFYSFLFIFSVLSPSCANLGIFVHSTFLRNIILFD